MPATGLQAHFTVIVTVTDTVTLTGLIVTVLDGKHYRIRKDMCTATHPGCICSQHQVAEDLHGTCAAEFYQCLSPSA